MGCGLFVIIFGVFFALFLQYKYDTHQHRIHTILTSYPSSSSQSHLTCRKIGENILHGPEDLTYSKQHDLLFISSHDRRDMFHATGSLYVYQPSKDELKHLNINYPQYFRPHGIAIVENCGSKDEIIIFVISHRFITPLPHAIEKFSYQVSTGKLTHLATLENELLVSPNDLIALNCDELLISNDNWTPNQLLGLVSGAFKIRSSDLIHFDGENWKNLNIKASFGNGLIIRTDPITNKEYLIRSSSADYSLLTYEISRSTDGKFNTINELISDEVLPFSPDNIEIDIHSGNLIITGHPSTELFLSHAIFRKRAPSVAVLYSTPGNYTTIYYDDGNQLSAASVATRSSNNKLYVGQVFDPFIMECSEMN